MIHMSRTRGVNSDWLYDTTQNGENLSFKCATTKQPCVGTFADTCSNSDTWAPLLSLIPFSKKGKKFVAYAIMSAITITRSKHGGRTASEAQRAIREEASVDAVALPRCMSIQTCCTAPIAMLAQKMSTSPAAPFVRHVPEVTSRGPKSLTLFRTRP